MIPKLEKRGGRYHWTKKHLALLGTMPDPELARLLKVTYANVAMKRESCGISKCPANRIIRWTPQMLGMLGKLPDKEVARLNEISLLSVVKKRAELGILCYARKSKHWHYWTKKEIALLGKMPDAEVAKRIGQKRASVTWKRTKLKIAPFGKSNDEKRPPRFLKDWKKSEIKLLGTMTDAELARKLDIAHSAVYKKRVSLGIPPFGRSQVGRNADRSGR